MAEEIAIADKRRILDIKFGSRFVKDDSEVDVSNHIYKAKTHILKPMNSDQNINTPS